MQQIEMRGLTALGLLIAMALIGASPAMAESTALCKKDENPCQSANTATLHATSIGKVKVLTSALTAECNALFLGDATSNLASPLAITGSFTYSTCSGNCTIVEENGPAAVSFLKLGHETADVTISLLLHVTCGAFFNCFYSGQVEGPATGPLLSTQSNGDVSFQEKVLSKEKGALCPATAKLDAVGTPLEAIYISS
jgi:hypothetical protein